MPRAQLPAQAIPAELRKKPLPPPFEDILTSGLRVTWRMPDPFSVIAFDGLIPDPITAAVIDLLKDEKQYTADTDPKKFRLDAAAIKGMYGLVARMMESPKLDPSLDYGDGETLGRREIGYMDVCQLYWRFRVGTRNPFGASSDADEPDRAADTPSTSGELRDDASTTDGDN